MNAKQSPDGLDRLLSDYFKSKMKQPWPSAPIIDQSEPSAPVAARNTPPLRVGDRGTRARVTLAASVALLLGTCWYLSGDRQSNNRGIGNKPAANGTTINLDNGTAGNPAALEHLKKDKATKPDPMPMDMKDVFK
jgi:hypothetical protein